MRFKQISEVLDWAAALHTRLAADYKRLADDQSRTRVGLLLDYLAEHETALASALEHYQNDADQRLLRTWYDKAPEPELPESLEGLCEELDCSDTAQVVGLAIRFHDLLIDLYTLLRDEAPTASVAELFTNLASMETQEKMRMVRDAEELEDL